MTTTTTSSHKPQSREVTLTHIVVCYKATNKAESLKCESNFSILMKLWSYYALQK